MNDILAEFKLFPFLRKGLAAGSSSNGSLSLGLTIKRSNDDGSTSSEETLTKDLSTYGPGDIIGIDQRLIIRTSPEKHVYDFETTNLVAIEFSRPDFPWMFTPVSPDGDKLWPWIVLIVVKSSDADVSNNPRNPLPILTINNPSGLPALNKAWSFAHVQGDKDVPDSNTNWEALLEQTPEKLISRIVSPQALDANEKYKAFLVPAYKSGVKAGLGEAFTGDESDPAWTGSEVSLRLPVYYHWEFGTGDKGDFKTLVRQLRGRPLPDGVGTREMDVSSPGATLDFSDHSPVLFESALVPPGFNRDENPSTIQSELREYLNKPVTEDFTGPVLGPPLYGNNQADRDHLHVDETSRIWFNTLNEDSRNRATAGLGTNVIQNDQEHLMHSAWEQVGDLKSVNEYFQQAQVARSAGTMLHEKHLKNLPLTSFLQATRTVQSRVIDQENNGQTVAGTLETGRIPAAFFSGAFQRLFRPNGAIAKRLFGDKALDGVSKLMDDINSGRISAEPDDTPPDGMVTPESTEVPIPVIPVPKWLEGNVAEIKKIVRAIAIGLLILFFLLVFVDLIPIALVVFVLLLGFSYAVKWLRDRLPNDALRDKFNPESYTGDAIRNTDASDSMDIAMGEGDGSATVTIRGTTFQQAAAKTLDDLYFTPAETKAPKKELNLNGIRTHLLQELDPVKTIPKRVRGRISIPGNLADPNDPIEPIRAAPYFPQPMYIALRDLSKDYILSGLEKIPQNTITIAQANRAFIESYMTGVNHEMGRELLWRGFPTELRATYFRQFWDVSDSIPDENLSDEQNADRMKDIDYIHRWRDHLGEHPSPSEDDVSTTPLVLMVRGDLLRRYPNTIIYAVKAKESEETGIGTTDRVPDASTDNNIRMPIFKGSMEADISFFGFNLAPDEVISDEGAADHQGWFFVLQEPVSDLSFKLPQNIDFATLAQSNPNAADVAKSIYNTPTLFAIHADGLIND